MAMAVTCTSSMHLRDSGKKEKIFCNEEFYIKTECFMIRRGQKGQFWGRQQLVFLLFVIVCIVTASIVGDLMEYLNIISVLLPLQLHLVSCSFCNQIFCYIQVIFPCLCFWLCHSTFNGMLCCILRKSSSEFICSVSSFVPVFGCFVTVVFECLATCISSQYCEVCIQVLCLMSSSRFIRPCC